MTWFEGVYQTLAQLRDILVTSEFTGFGIEGLTWWHIIFGMALLGPIFSWIGALFWGASGMRQYGRGGR